MLPSAGVKVIDSNGFITNEWYSFFNLISQTCYNTVQSGTTANRPNINTPILWIGMQYFDTTLGYPIYLKSVTPVFVWVNGAGIVV